MGAAAKSRTFGGATEAQPQAGMRPAGVAWRAPLHRRPLAPLEPAPTTPTPPPCPDSHLPALPSGLSLPCRPLPCPHNPHPPPCPPPLAGAVPAVWPRQPRLPRRRPRDGREPRLCVCQLHPPRGRGARNPQPQRWGEERACMLWECLAATRGGASHDCAAAGCGRGRCRPRGIAALAPMRAQ